MMKQLIIVVLICIFAQVSYGAESVDMTAYVRKDIYDLQMQNVITRLDKISAQLDEQGKAIADLSMRLLEVTERLNGKIDTLSARVDGIDARMSDLRNDIYLALVVLGVIIGLPSIKRFMQWRDEKRKAEPAITLEDVQRLIDERLKLGRNA